MLYKFKSQATADVIMEQHSGDAMLAAIGREPAARGAITVADMPAAISAIEKAIQASRAKEQQPQEDEKEEHDSIPFHTRAQPFLDMLKQALSEEADVVWGV